MTTVTLGNPLSYPLHPITWRPDGSAHYRVTNPFDGPDFLNGGIHRATDVGNFRMDDVVKAPAACRGRGLRHTDSALGVEFDLGNGVVLSLWHLNATLAPLGTWLPLARGQVVGRTGNTGARLSDGKGGTMPMPAHTHIAASRNGVPFDVEPFLPMPERPAKALILEEDMSALERKTRFLDQPYIAELLPGTAIRADAETIGEPVNRSPLTGEPWRLTVIGIATGEAVNGSDRWEVYGVHSRGLATFHSSTVARRIPITDTTAIDNKLAGARTAVDGAAQAIAAAQRSLA